MENSEKNKSNEEIDKFEEIIEESYVDQSISEELSKISNELNSSPAYYKEVYRSRRSSIEAMIGTIILICSMTLLTYLGLFKNEKNGSYIFFGILIIFFLIGYRLLKPPASIEIPYNFPMDSFEKYKELTGLSGILKSINMTGLPLVTICITLIFCILAIGSYGINAIGYFNNLDKDIIPQDFPELVLELSKLTLGAFIGSYVSKN